MRIHAVRYGHREERRAEHFYGGDPHDAPMPMDYFLWAVVVGAALGPETRDVDFEDDLAGEAAVEKRPRTGRFVRDGERETVATAPRDA